MRDCRDVALQFRVRVTKVRVSVKDGVRISTFYSVTLAARISAGPHFTHNLHRRRQHPRRFFRPDPRNFCTY